MFIDTNNKLSSKMGRSRSNPIEGNKKQIALKLHFTPPPTRLEENVSCIKMSALNECDRFPVPFCCCSIILSRVLKKNEKRLKDFFSRKTFFGTSVLRPREEYRVGITTIIYDGSIRSESCVINIPSKSHPERTKT